MDAALHGGQPNAQVNLERVDDRASVKAIVDGADVVFAVWPDELKPNGIDFLLIKGSREIGAGLKVKAISMASAEQAITCYQRFGDGEAEALRAEEAERGFFGTWGVRIRARRAGRARYEAQNPDAPERKRVIEALMDEIAASQKADLVIWNQRSGCCLRAHTNVGMDWIKGHIPDDNFKGDGIVLDPDKYIKEMVTLFNKAKADGLILIFETVNFG